MEIISKARNMGREDTKKDDDVETKKSKKKSADGSKYIDINPTINEILDDSEMFDLVKNGQFEDFCEMLPEELSEYAEDLYDSIIMDVLDEEELTERGVLSVQQRRARGRSMKRRKGRNKMARKRAARRKASPEKLRSRAKKKARNSIRDRLSGGKKYSQISPAQKVQVDKRLSKIPSSRVASIAKRELPKVRKAEMERLARRRSKKNEDINEEFENFISEKAQRPLVTKKRPHKLFNKDGSVKCDKRFKMFKPSKNNLTEETFLDEAFELMDVVESFITESNFSGDREEGTSELVSTYIDDIPGQYEIEDDFGDFESGDRVRFIKRSIDSGVGYTELEGTVIGSNVQHLRIRDDDGKLYRIKHTDVVLEDD